MARQLVLSLGMLLFGIFLFNTNEISQTQPRGIEAANTGVPGVMAYRSLPNNFHFDTASPADLVRYGLPLRPDKERYPESYAQWLALAKAAQHRATPQLQQTDIYHRSAIIYHGPARIISHGPPATSDNWSGFAIFDPNNPFMASAPNSSIDVTGTFTVPRWDRGACAPPGAPGGHVFSSAWVGIDGWGSGDVLETGFESDWACDQFAGLGVWLEWFTAPSYLPAGQSDDDVPGMVFKFDVIVTNVNNVHHYGLTITDLLGMFTPSTRSFDITPPTGTRLVGDSIEWIVERPSIHGVYAYLRPYVVMGWSSLNAAVTNSSGTVNYKPSSSPSGTVNTIIMKQNGRAVSTPELYADGTVSDKAWFHSSTPY
jgi:hypothetical protein